MAKGHDGRKGGRIAPVILSAAWSPTDGVQETETAEEQICQELPAS